MLTRALIVVLVALNLGVAAWWLLRPATPDAALPVSSKGGVELQLLPAPVAQARPAAPEAQAVVPDTPQATPAPAPATCLRLGPFPDRDAVQVAQKGLGVLLHDTAIREEPGAASAYSVLLPPAGDRARAQATADRITAAGFRDFFILTQGADANGIALGVYRGREAAERRQSALRAAGFPAELRSQGATGAGRWWLDGHAVDAAAVRIAFPGAQDRDCALLR